MSAPVYHHLCWGGGTGLAALRAICCRARAKSGVGTGTGAHGRKSGGHGACEGGDGSGLVVHSLPSSHDLLVRGVHGPFQFHGVWCIVQIRNCSSTLIPGIPLRRYESWKGSIDIGEVVHVLGSGTGTRSVVGGSSTVSCTLALTSLHCRCGRLVDRSSPKSTGSSGLQPGSWGDALLPQGIIPRWRLVGVLSLGKASPSG